MNIDEYEAHKDDWKVIGVSTTPGDRQEIIKSVNDAYGTYGEEPPQYFVWFPSPLAGIHAAAMLKLMEVPRIGENPDGFIPYDTNELELRDIKQPCVVKKTDWKSIWDTLVSQIKEQHAGDTDWFDRMYDDWLYSQIELHHLWKRASAIRDQAYKCGYGSMDAAGLGFYEYFMKKEGLDDVEKLAPMMELAKHSGWWWAFDKVVVVTEKPIAINLDDEGRLHCIGGPAFEYRDGWKMYAVEGIEIPEKWGMAAEDDWDIQWAFETENLEQRRIVMKLCGPKKLLTRSGSTSEVIHTDGVNALYKITDVMPFPIHLLEVKDPSTGEYYHLFVPRETKKGHPLNTCEEARMWTLHIDEPQESDTELVWEA